jgi:hypothetical protein
MIPSQTNPTNPANEPNKTQPTVGPQQTDAEKKALADKAAATGNSTAKT